MSYKAEGFNQLQPPCRCLDVISVPMFNVILVLFLALFASLCHVTAAVGPDANRSPVVRWPIAGLGWMSVVSLASWSHCQGSGTGIAAVQ